VNREEFGPTVIAPPPQVRLAAISLLAQAVAVLVLAVLIITGRRDADLTWALATASYFLILAALMGVVAAGLLRGRRWSRNPAIVISLLVALIGFYLAVPSEQLAPGLAIMAVGAGTLLLLLGPASNEWIKSFPSPFGDRDI
jgi:peptidoglycan/LPS O-acetylase OafA/YrhL